jgi:DNA-binding NtrC family response regulator
VKVLLNSVLIIDDDEDLRNMLVSILDTEGYQVEAVKNGKEAIKSCEKFHFDVALIDIELPDIKGTELLERLKKLRPKMIRIIITGHPSLENAMKAVNERADGYILKPFEVADLLKLIKRLLSEKTDEYLRMYGELTHEKENNPFVKYQNPDKW